MLALTATASKQRRKKIQKLLGMQTCKELIENPNRDNIKFHVQHVSSTAPMTETFGWLLTLLRKHEAQLPRILVFCKSIDDCSRIYCFCKRYLTKQLLQHVDMYHSQTPENTKSRIREDMAAADGRVRVLVCTNAAGMGVNYSAVNNVVNYGPPQEMDTLLQQQGRAGRSGDQAHHLLLYHNRQLRNVDIEVLDYTRNEDSLCRRQIMLRHYSADCDESRVLHSCCDMCEKDCSCESADCTECIHIVHTVQEPEDSGSEDEHKASNATAEQCQALKLSLQQYKRQLDEDAKSASVTTAPEVTHGFTEGVIDTVVDNCTVLKSPDDVLAQCEVWSYDQAKTVFVIVASVLELESDVTDSDSEYMTLDD